LLLEFEGRLVDNLFWQSTILIMCSPSKSHGIRFEEICRKWSKNRATGEVVSDLTFNPRQTETAPFPSWMPCRLIQALADRGITHPYSHQVTSWDFLHRGCNTVIATPTASGKTLCYNAPILSRLSQNPHFRALYLFPTKALSRDQEESIVTLSRAADINGIITVYDGDTPSDQRRTAKKEAQILITNPDMLHIGILPHHADWASFFAGLSFVVIDELHMYRGVLGSHVANVLRRACRISAFYSSNPTFAASSATISNPRELAETIVGQPFEVVRESGAPEGPKRFVIFNPAVVDPERGIRRSALKESAKLAGDLILAGIKTLIFCQTRTGVELVLRYVRDRISEHAMDPERVRGYRGGYLPTVRREIETALRQGELDAVVATNALELGIDIGSLDAVVMAGYPGTIAGFRQRAGRAGRRQSPSLAVLVTSSNPLDQFLARHPHYLVQKTPERALVQPDNVEILLAHLRCATFELPFSIGETFGSLSAQDAESVLSFLLEEGDFSLSKHRYYYIGDAYPAAAISLRNIHANRVVVIDKQSKQAIAEVDSHAARLELHEQAIYLNEGQTYHVDKLDLDSQKAFLKKVDPVYYTKPISDVALAVIEERGRRSFPGGTAVNGDVKVTEKITGFKKIRFHTHENLGYGDVHLPTESMETESTWFMPSKALYQALSPYGGVAVMQALVGLGHAVHQIAALRLMCDPRDILFVVQAPTGDVPEKEDGEQLALFFYDSHLGGVGLSDQAFEEALPILNDAKHLIEGCRCTQGCPTCVGPLDQSSPIVKEIAIALATGLTGPIPTLG
jgi:DEAD/DEAH box helicase domain-containing protein